MKLLVEAFSTYVCVLFSADREIQCDPDDALRIVHLTDLHFGPKTTRERHLSQIGMCLQNNDLRGHFLALTGDGIDKGDAESFKYVSDWLGGALAQDWLTRNPSGESLPSQRVFLAPGNHDFNECIAASHFLIRDAREPTTYRFRSKDELPSGDLWKYGMAPYLGFHQQVTGWRCELGSYPGMRLSGRFVALGVFFLELWLYEYSIATYPPLVDSAMVDKILANMSKAINASTVSGDCVVVLCHKFKASGIEHQITNDLTIQLTKHASDRAILVLSGHYHENEVGPTTKCNRILRVQGGTLDDARKASNTLSNLGVITLHRKNSQVRACDVNRIEFGEHGWEVAHSKKKSFELDATRGWIPAA